MKKVFLLLPVIAILLNSCGGWFVPTMQKVEVELPDKEVDIYVNEDYVELDKDGKLKLDRKKSNQVTIKKEGYKDRSIVPLRSETSNWTYMRFFPAVLGAAMAFGSDDYTTNEFGIGILSYSWLPMMWTGDVSLYGPIKFPEMIKKETWNEGLKRIYVSTVSIDVGDKDVKFKGYDYDSYMDGDDENYSYDMDSISYPNTVFADKLYEILEENQFIDSNETVFHDNINTLKIEANIKALNINFINHTGWAGSGGGFIVTEVTCDWMLKDIFGSVIYEEEITTSSDQFTMTSSKKGESKSSMVDALENGMYKFMQVDKVKEYSKIEEYKMEEADLSLRSVSMSPTKYSQGIKSTVTIKSEDGHGSGFFITNNGYLITNYHVVNDVEEITVVTNDGEEFEGNVIRVNRKYDLALVKINHDNEYAFDLSKKKEIGPGDEVVAIGTPKSVELGQSISKGIVSGIRTNDGIDWIQTDASISPGNSGGPIVSEDGLVVGVADYKIIGYGVEGINFCIPGKIILDELNLKYK